MNPPVLLDTQNLYKTVGHLICSCLLSCCVRVQSGHNELPLTMQECIGTSTDLGRTPPQGVSGPNFILLPPYKETAGTAIRHRKNTISFNVVIHIWALQCCYVLGSLLLLPGSTVEALACPHPPLMLPSWVPPHRPYLGRHTIGQHQT